MKSKNNDTGWCCIPVLTRQLVRRRSTPVSSKRLVIFLSRGDLDQSGQVTFTGYDDLAGDATVTGLLVGGAPVPAAGAGTEVEVVLDRTPFYAEGGGQLADAGLITGRQRRGRRRPDRGARRAGPGARAHRAPRPGHHR